LRSLTFGFPWIKHLSSDHIEISGSCPRFLPSLRTNRFLNILPALRLQACRPSGVLFRRRVLQLESATIVGPPSSCSCGGAPFLPSGVWVFTDAVKNKRRIFLFRLVRNARRSGAFMVLSDFCSTVLSDPAQKALVLSGVTFAISALFFSAVRGWLAKIVLFACPRFFLRNGLRTCRPSPVRTSSPLSTCPCYAKPLYARTAFSFPPCASIPPTCYTE